MEPKENVNEMKLLQDCVSENLSQARHVENERLSFLRVYLVLVGVVGTLITDGSLYKQNIALLLLIALVLISGVLAIMLTIRWNKVFDIHRKCAIRCYQKIYRLVYNHEGEVVVDYIEGKTGVLKEFPLYCFMFDFSLSKNRRTGTWFCAFYGIITGAVGLVLIVYYLKYWILSM